MRFIRIGSVITAFTDSDLMMMNSVLLYDACPVIAISISGPPRSSKRCVRPRKPAQEKY